jgi:SNF2 family DNA or RNA helicase
MPLIDYQKQVFIVPGAQTPRVRTAPTRKYVTGQKVWHLPDNVPNRRFLRGAFLSTEFTPAAAAAVQAADTKSVAAVAQFPCTPPGALPHQIEALARSYGKPGYGYFHDMGSGKSRTLLEMYRALFGTGQIDEAWVICPNTLIGNWHDQIRLWTPELASVIKVYGVLSLSAGRLPAQLVAAARPRIAVAVDESQRIKNPNAKRTQVVCDIGSKAGFRYILTGTPVTRGVEDLYSQFKFLDPDILGYDSFYSFRNRYCVIGGFENRQIVGYQYMDELMATISPYVHVVKDPVELPPMSKQTNEVTISAEQRRLLSELKNEMRTEFAGESVTVENALAYMTRGAQILGGFFPGPEGSMVELSEQPKLDELKEIVSGTDHKTVIFCRFIAEAKLVQKAIPGTVWLASTLSPDEKTAMIDRFQNDPDCRTIVMTYATGALGFTLTAARLLVKYSGTFNFEEAIQSEKRIHRIGQNHSTMVVTIMAAAKLDRHIKNIADNKQSLADFVTGSLRNPAKLIEDLF